VAGLVDKHVTSQQLALNGMDSAKLQKKKKKKYSVNP
jgi:hypothetical protein